MAQVNYILRNDKIELTQILWSERLCKYKYKRKFICSYEHQLFPWKSYRRPGYTDHIKLLPQTRMYNKRFVINFVFLYDSV